MTNVKMPQMEENAIQAIKYQTFYRISKLDFLIFTQIQISQYMTEISLKQFKKILIPYTQ